MSELAEEKPVFINSNLWKRREKERERERES